MVNLVQDVVTNFFKKVYVVWVFVSLWVTRAKFQDTLQVLWLIRRSPSLKLLIFEAPYILIYIIDIFNLQNGIKHPCSSTDFYFKSKIVEDCHEIQKCYVFQLLGFFPQNVHFDVATFYLAYHLSSHSFFSVVVQIYMIHFSDEAYFPSCNCCYYEWE